MPGTRMGDNKESELVRVNVGGTFYSTTKGTLLSEQDSFFSKILKEKPQQKDDRGGYYFIDRDGAVFRHVLNYLRDREHFHLPDGFTEFPLLTAEAQYYALPGLTARLTGEQAQLNYIELIETCHPEKIGVCSARVVLSEALKETAPFSELLEALPKDHDEYTGLSGRLWVRTETTRADWAVRLRQHGWFFAGYTSLNRRLPDITGHGTDLCHIVEKWGKL